MGNDRKPMHHNSKKGITHIEYYEIDVDPKNSDNGIFIRFGRQNRIGHVDASKESVEGVIHHPDGKFPKSNDKLRENSSQYRADSSQLSLLNVGEKVLYVFKIRDDLNWYFDRDRHPFAIHPHNDADEEILKTLFSDCRLFDKKSNGKIEVIKPKESDRGAGTRNRDGFRFPQTNWAGFVFNGDKARDHQDMRKSFEIFIVDQNDKPIGLRTQEYHRRLEKGIKSAEEAEKLGLRHPPAWPADHNDVV